MVSVALFRQRTQTLCFAVIIVKQTCNLKSVHENREISEVRILENQNYKPA
jgi:hypothetical protein